MGLATTYGVVRQHGGLIWVFSKPGEGTTVKVCLPRLEQVAVDAIITPSPVPTNAPEGSETVLVVEDENIVRRMVLRILKSKGYEVLSASNGVEALDVASSYDDVIHLLLTDVIMPQMNGKELRDEIRKVRPKTRALYMSGYADAVIAQHGVLDEDADFLQKPFSVWALTSKVREALDSNLPEEGNRAANMARKQAKTERNEIE